MMHAPAQRTEPTLGELFSELARETGTLVRQEVKLASTELSEKAKSAGKDAAMIGVGGVIAHIGLLALVGGVIVALGGLMPLWIAAMLVGAALALTGFVLARKGMNAIKQIDPVPRETVRTMKENQLWVREQTR
jgi:hypothetical protein